MWAERASPLDLPSGLPANWPAPTPADLEALPHRHVTVGPGRQRFYFAPNRIKTNRYDGFNFLPKFLYLQFNPYFRLANCHFLVSSVLQCVPHVSNTEGIPTILMPLCLLLMVDAAFAYFEDSFRIKNDAEINNVPVSRYDYQLRRFVDIKSGDVRVGDLIQVKVKTVIPADMVIFAVAEKQDPPMGVCFVETRSLDGETNLKQRNALSLTYNLMQDIAVIDGLKGEVVMEHPNKFVDEFSGLIDLDKFGRQAIQHENLLLRGHIFRCTDWAIGLVVNTANDTKIMMASNKEREKISAVEETTNVQIMRVTVLLLILSIAGAFGATLYNFDYAIGESWYLEFYPDEGDFFFVNVGYFFVLHGMFVPISLYISISFARYVQSYFMQKDLEMYSSKLDHACQVRNARLTEDLGTITHVFADKTGTLTRNMLDFRKASINGVQYGTGITELGRNVWKLQNRKVPDAVLLDEERAQSVAVPHVTFYCPKYEDDVAGGPSATNLQRAKIQQFFRHLSICHEVVCERDPETGSLNLSAPNPDDECHVHAAAYFGFRFRDRKDRFVVIENRDRRNAQEEIEILETISFSHTRRRMSVIIKDVDETIVIITKGADSVLVPRLANDLNDPIVTATLEDVRKFTIEGLRVLLVASAVIPAERFYEWHKQYHAMKSDPQHVELRKAGKYNHIDELEDSIERDLFLMGCVGVEDKLQFGATGCIQELTAAGINVWLMTGDKDESAQQVAIASNLLLPKAYMHRVNLVGRHVGSPADMAAMLRYEIAAFDNELSEVGVLNTKPRALLIDGVALSLALSDNNPDVENGLNALLLRFLQRTRCVVASRVTPADKSDLVRFTRLFLPGARTLAIGDGANDVSMIREANVGVGIKGLEGMDAVQASDFAISQIRFLAPLVLKHGHWNYVRTSNLICYTFYKNILMGSALFWFNLNCAYTGQKLFTEGTIQMYNVLYTTASALLYAVYDHHVSANSCYAYPQLYRSCLNNEFFDNWVFWGWVATAVGESIIISVVPMYTMVTVDTFAELGLVSMTACVIVVNAKFLVLQTCWHWWTVALIVVQFGLLVASFAVISALEWFDFASYGLLGHVLQNPSAWLTLLLQVVTIVGKDVYLAALDRAFNFKPTHIAQELDAGLGKFGSYEKVVPFVPTLLDSSAESVKLSSKVSASPATSPSGGGGGGGGSGSSSKAKVSVVSLSTRPNPSPAGASSRVEAKSPEGAGTSSPAAAAAVNASPSPSPSPKSFLKRVVALKGAELRAAEAPSPSPSPSPSSPPLSPPSLPLPDTRNL